MSNAVSFIVLLITMYMVYSTLCAFKAQKESNKEKINAGIKPAHYDKVKQLFYGYLVFASSYALIMIVFQIVKSIIKMMGV